MAYFINLFQLVNSILDARKSIDLALFEITSEELSGEWIHEHLILITRTSHPYDNYHRLMMSLWIYCIDFLLLRYNAVLSNTVGRRYSWTRPIAGKFIQTNYQIWMNFPEIGLAQKLFDIFYLWILSFGWAFQIFLSIFVDRKVSKTRGVIIKIGMWC